MPTLQQSQAPRQTPVGLSLSSRLRHILLIVALMTVGAGLTGCGYNRAPALEERAKGALGEVSNQYQQRADLVPALVGAVKGFATTEREVLSDLIAARAKAGEVSIDASAINNPGRLQAFQTAQSALSGAIEHMIAIAERDPEIKSNPDFLALQALFEDNRNRITVARRDYNDAVRAHNTEIATLPGLIWARLVWGAKPLEAFPASTRS